MSSMKDSNASIARALIQRLRDGESMIDLSRSTAAYLIEERRQSDLGVIIRDVERLLLEEEGALYVRATTARPLEIVQQAEIEQLFKRQSGVKKVIVEEIIDTDVIGGVRCETADQQLDLTVRRQLQSLKVHQYQTV